MPLPKGGKLDSASWDKVMAHINGDPDAKREFTDRMSQGQFRKAIEEIFELDQNQKNELGLMKKDFEEVCGRAVQMTLSNNGKIEYQYAGRTPPNLTIEIYAKRSEVGIRFIF